MPWLEETVQLAGVPSWRFAEGIEQLPLVALCVRDALALPVPDGTWTPPRLEAELPDQSVLLDTRQRSAAGAQWARWWRAVLAHCVRGHQGPSTGADQDWWIRQVLMPEGAALFDPPEFVAHSDHPELRTALQRTFPDAARWAETLRHSLLDRPTARPAQFGYQVVRDIAEQTARRHHVTPDAVQACAVVLPVAGVWWRRIQPGAIVCSVHAARDPATAIDALTEAFESGLND